VVGTVDPQSLDNELRGMSSSGGSTASSGFAAAKQRKAVTFAQVQSSACRPPLFGRHRQQQRQQQQQHSLPGLSNRFGLASLKTALGRLKPRQDGKLAHRVAAT